MKSCIVLLLLLLLTTFVTATQRDSDPPPSPPIITGLTCGSLVGKWMTVKNHSGYTKRVAAFLGVPFAQPPVGALRFAAPVPLSAGDKNCNWTERNPYNATYFRSFCTQTGNTAQQIIGDEDCLFLNVYLSEEIYYNSSGGEKSSRVLHPVSFYIYGGDLTNGGANWEPHAFFAAFANENGSGDGPGVIAVTINYRLSILGFLGAAELESFNFGIQDQIAALKFVQKEIIHFNGDKNKVTIAGQSSGGTSVFSLVASRHTAGLFRAAISFSGSPNISLDRAGKFKQDLSIVESLCPQQPSSSSSSSNSTTILQCLRTKSVDELFAAVPNSWNTPGMWSFVDLPKNGRGFAGLVFVDGDVVSMPFQDALRAGSGINENVTVVMSNMGQECNLIAAHQVVRNYSQQEWRGFLRHAFRDWGPRTSATMAEQLFSLYELESRGVNPQLAYASLNTDYGISCANQLIATTSAISTAAAANHRKKRAGSVFIAVNQWPPQNPNTNSEQSYAYHLWDYISAIEAADYLYPYKQTQIDYEFARLVRSDWARLIKTGTMSATDGPIWKAVDEGINNFPQEFNTFVYSRRDRFPFMQHGSGNVVSYKQKICETLLAYGLNQRFWWVD